MPEIDDPRINSQYEHIQRSYADQGIPTYIEINEETGDPVAIYPNDRLVVREERLGEVRDLFSEGNLPDADIETIAGLRIVRIVGGTARDARRTIEAALGQDVVDFDYILSITPGGKCPAGEPEVPNPCGECAPPCPPVAAEGGAGVQVVVCDTGLLGDANSHPWLRGVTGDLEPLDAIDPPTGLPRIGKYVGHGTMIAGVVRCTAPDAHVQVAGHLPTALGGSNTASTIAVALTDILASGVRVISLSAGSQLPGDVPGLVLSQFVANNAAVLADTVIVAAAGNDAISVPFWPAAFDAPWMLSVGALGGDNRHLAWFSDFNPPAGQPWIDVFAPGENLVNAFASGLYVYDEPPRKGSRQIFAGMARWSGTSFATPLVAGLLATRMTAAGETPQQARGALLALAQTQAIPGVGPALYARR
jgi:hypothetical protein